MKTDRALSLSSLVAIAALSVWTLASATAASAQSGRVPAGLFNGASNPAGRTIPADPAVSRRRVVEVDSDLLGETSILLNLFDDVSLVATRDRLAGDPSGAVIWIGHLDGVEHSRVILVSRNDVVSGTVRWPGGLATISYAGDGLHVVDRIDAENLPPHQDPLAPPPDTAGALESDDAGTTESGGPVSAAAGGPLIDLMIVYTERSRARYNPTDGGADGIETRILNAVTDANDAYLNSGMSIQFRLVHMAQVAYDETSGNMNQSLNELTSTSDGQLDEVHAWRDTYGADLVSLITEDGGYCGIAWVMQNVGSGFQSHGFSVVYSVCLPTQTLAHETGHNEGAMHDRANSSVAGAYPYSYGHRHPSNWYTIMAYSCSGCGRIDHFSNPDVLYGGVPTGIDHDVDPNNSADNARTFNNTVSTVASFRASAPTEPPLAPSGLTATADSDEAIGLDWSDNADNEGGFDIERSPDGLAWAPLVALPANSIGYTDSGLDSETTYHYRLRATNAAGDSAWAGPANATTLEPPAFIDDVAQADLPSAGSVAGSYLQTRSDGNGVQAIGERESGGKKRNRYSYLEHAWRFDVRGGTAVTLHANAYGTASSDGDTFALAYSGDGSSYTEMFEIVKTSDDGTYQTYVLPASTSGTLYVRVIDSDRMPGNTSLDTITIDHLFVRSDTGSGSGTPPAAPTTLAATAMSASQIDLAWDDQSPDELGFEIERSPDGAAWEMIATTGAGMTDYADPGLAPNTLYNYRVRSYNGAGGSAHVADQATTMDGSAISLQAFGYKVRGVQHSDLTWSGATTLNVEITLDGAPITQPATANDGAYTDNIGVKGGGAYSYQLCEAGSTTNCSDPVNVVF